MRVDVVPPTSMPAPGATTDLAVVLRIEPKWHVYWRNSGDSGMPPSIQVLPPSGWTVGPIRWPQPTRFSLEGETTFGYENSVALFVPVTAPSTLPASGATPVEFTVDASWMVCRTACLTGSTKRMVRLPASPAPGTDASELSAIVEASRSRLPKPLSALAGASATIDRPAAGRTTLLVTGPAQGTTQLDFFPFDTPGVTYGRPELSIADGRFRVAVAIEINPGNSLGKPLAAAGLVTLSGAAIAGSNDVPGTSGHPSGSGAAATGGSSFEFSLPVAVR
ncbi:MAG: protein-disulfide reductase DsbD family protein [Phycisphaerales bacterium]